MDGFRLADQPEDVVKATIADLKDETEYYGVPAATSTLLSAVGAHSRTVELVVFLVVALIGSFSFQQRQLGMSEPAYKLASNVNGA